MTADDLDRLLADPPTGGVFRIDDPDLDAVVGSQDQGSDQKSDQGSGQEGLAGLLTAAGWVVKPLAGIEDREAFYTEISTRLGFPHYFGRNLDALYDSLRDLREPTAVIIPWRRLEERDPHWAARVLAVLAERAARGPAFAVILRD